MDPEEFDRDSAAPLVEVIDVRDDVTLLRFERVQFPPLTVKEAVGLLPAFPDLVRVNVEVVEPDEYPVGTDVVVGENDAPEIA